MESMLVTVRGRPRVSLSLPAKTKHQQQIHIMIRSTRAPIKHSIRIQKSELSSLTATRSFRNIKLKNSNAISPMKSE